MAWIELHQAVPHHRKTLSVADELGIAPIQVTGHLVGLWLWALDSAPDGALRATDRTIARAAQWEGNPSDFVRALVSAGYLDRADQGYAIHDWHDYTGRLLELKERTRQANRQRQKRWRETTHGALTRESRVRLDRDVTPNNGLTGPNLTKPNQDLSSGEGDPGGGSGGNQHGAGAPSTASTTTTETETELLDMLARVKAYPFDRVTDGEHVRRLVRDFGQRTALLAIGDWCSKREVAEGRLDGRVARLEHRRWCRQEKRWQEEAQNGQSPSNGHRPDAPHGRGSARRGSRLPTEEERDRQDREFEQPREANPPR